MAALIFKDVRYYYFRDADRRPLVTLCRVLTESGWVGYGHAICSPGDNPSRQIGQSYALGRAIAALSKPHRGMLCLSRTGMPQGKVIKFARAVTRKEACETALRCDNLHAHGLYTFLFLHNPFVLPASIQPPLPEEPLL